MRNLLLLLNGEIIGLFEHEDDINEYLIELWDENYGVNNSVGYYVDYAAVVADLKTEYDIVEITTLDKLKKDSESYGISKQEWEINRHLLKEFTDDFEMEENKIYEILMKELED